MSKNINVSSGSSGSLPTGSLGPMPGLNIDKNMQENLMNMVSQMSQGLQNNPNQKLDLNGMIDQLTGVFGSSMNPDMQNDLKKMTKTVFNTLMTDTEDEFKRPENSKIHFDEARDDLDNDRRDRRAMPVSPDHDHDHSDKHYKVPEKSSLYDIIDDNESIDEFNPRTKDIVIKLDVSLEEIFNGRDKKIAITRKRFKKDPKTNKDVLVLEKKKILIPIEKGSKDEQVIRYSKQASEEFGCETGDIVISLKENGHSNFERIGDNIFVSKNISLYESYASAAGILNLSLYTLDKKYLRLDSCGITLHTNDGLRKLSGFGFPVYRSDKRGSLYIRFNLILPDIVDPKIFSALKANFPVISQEIIYNDGTLDHSSLDPSTPVVNVKMDLLNEKDHDSLQEDEEYSDSDSDSDSEDSRSGSGSRSGSESSRSDS
jgi:DnaJ-class molecular chaperone